MLSYMEILRPGREPQPHNFYTRIEDGDPY